MLLAGTQTRGGAVAAVLLLVGCASEPPSLEQLTVGSASTGSGEDTGAPQMESTATSGNDGADTATSMQASEGSADTAAPESTTQSPDDSTGPGCEPTPIVPEPAADPVDVIVTLDGSASMGFEWSNVGPSFPVFLENLHGLGDVHLALLAGDAAAEVGLCVEPPFGSGGCPESDSDPPQFVHVTDAPQNDILDAIVVSHPQWQTIVREEADVHLVSVSDDDAATTAAAFTDAFVALDPGYDGLTYHAFVASHEPDEPCRERIYCCVNATAEGSVHAELAAQTGGALHDLCEPAPALFFLDVLEAVGASASPPCQYEAPEGVDAGEIEVLADGRPVEWVGSAASCDAAGWYLEGGRLKLCPASCGADIELQVGC